MEVGIQGHSRWVEFTKQHHSKMKTAIQGSWANRDDMQGHFRKEKKLIDDPIEVIITYNKHYRYSILSRDE